MADPYIDLLVWQRHREEPYCHANFLNGDPAEHCLNACRQLFTQRQLGIHAWMERMVYAYTHEPVVIMMGSASSGKSHVTGLLTVLDYVASLGGDPADAEGGGANAPGNLYAILVSTSKDQLLKRSMASAIEYTNYLRTGKYSVPIRYIKQSCAILPEAGNEEDIATTKSRIDGVAISEGSAEQAKGAVIGVHLPRVRAVADELENMGVRAQYFLDAQSNLMAGTVDYKRVILFNPQSESLPGSRLARPAGGYGTINLATEEWRNEAGQLVLRFDGLKSPGVTHPDKFPYLPTEESMKRIVDDNHGNWDSPNVWAFVRAMPPRLAGAQTVISREMVDRWGMREPVQWASRPDSFAALDPAYTSGGNECVLVRGQVGIELKSGRVVICFDPEPYVVPLQASSDKPALQQIGEGVKAKLEEWGIPITRLACDDSGTQNVADHLEIIMGRGIYRCNYNARPPRVALPDGTGRVAPDKYRNTVTYMYYLVNEFAQYGQIRGLPEKAVEEFVERRLDVRLKGTLVIESKKDFKARMRNGESPDTSDACAQLVGMVRDRFGLVPGGDRWSMDGGYDGRWEYEDECFRRQSAARMAEINNLDLDPRRYT